MGGHVYGVLRAQVVVGELADQGIGILNGVRVKESDIAKLFGGSDADVAHDGVSQEAGAGVARCEEFHIARNFLAVDGEEIGALDFVVDAGNGEAVGGKPWAACRGQSI